MYQKKLNVVTRHRMLRGNTVVRLGAVNADMLTLVPKSFAAFAGCDLRGTEKGKRTCASM